MPAELQRFAHDPHYQAALNALENNEGDSRARAKQDPEGYLRSHGVNIPPGARVTFQDQQ